MDVNAASFTFVWHCYCVPYCWLGCTSFVTTSCWNISEVGAATGMEPLLFCVLSSNKVQTFLTEGSCLISFIESMQWWFWFLEVQLYVSDVGKSVVSTGLVTLHKSQTRLNVLWYELIVFVPTTLLFQKFWCLHVLNYKRKDFEFISTWPPLVEMDFGRSGWKSLKPNSQYDAWSRVALRSAALCSCA